MGPAHAGEQSRCEQAEQAACCATRRGGIRVPAHKPAPVDRDRPYRRVFQLVAAAPVVRAKTTCLVLPTFAVDDVEAVPADLRSVFQACIATRAGERHDRRLGNARRRRS